MVPPVLSLVDNLSVLLCREEDSREAQKGGRETGRQICGRETGRRQKGGRDSLGRQGDREEGRHGGSTTAIVHSIGCGTVYDIAS